MRRVGRDEIVFAIAVVGLTAMTIGAIIWNREADATLVAAFVGLLGLPVFLKSERRNGDG